MWRWSWLPLALSLLNATAIASDLVREQRYAIEIKESLAVGKAISLKAGDQEFLAIHGEAVAGEARGAAILLHGMGGDPAWSPVIQPLRIGLPDHSWETLSLQMPVAPAGADGWSYTALIPEAAPRISAAIEFLKQRKIKKIVIIGHSLGVRMGLEALASGLPKEVIAFVAIGTPTNSGDTETGVLGALAKINLPILDIYGSRDLSSVVKGAKARAMAANKAGNSGYEQLEIAGANHFFVGLEDSLLARVRAWIGKQAAGSKGVAEEEDGAEQQQK